MSLDEINHECGICAIVLKKPLEEYRTGGASFYLFEMLNQLQHRGKKSAGIVTYHPDCGKNLKRHVGLGLVNEVFSFSNPQERKEIFKYHHSPIGIGHVRYATSGDTKGFAHMMESLEEAQPFLRPHGRVWKRFGLAVNGNLANHEELKNNLLKKHDYLCETNVDTEVMAHYIAIDMKKEQKSWEDKAPLEKVINHACSNFDGAYAAAMLNGRGNIFAFKDPRGFKPLCYGENENFVAIASESIALSKIGIKDFYEIKPGEIIRIDNKGKMFFHEMDIKANESQCIFEKVYFANSCSIIDKVCNNDVRQNLGKEIARIEPLRERKDFNEFIVVPIPDSSKPFALSLSKALGLEYVEGLLKNKTSGRTFIQEEGSRNDTISSAYQIVPNTMNEKKIIFADDSIVRGSTIQNIVKNIEEEQVNPKEMHFRSSCPPILAPCFYGTDFPTLSELIATKYNSVEKLEESLARETGVNSVIYQKIDGFIKSMQIPENKLCLACLNGNYPTPKGQEKYNILKSLQKDHS